MNSAAAKEPITLFEVVNPKDVATQIRDSAECVLIVALAREGFTATTEQIKRLAREIGNNSAQTVCALEIK